MGKSTLIMDILRQHNRVQYGVMPHRDEYIELLDQLVQRQRQNPDERAYVALDDCIVDNTWTRNPNMNLLFANGRSHRLLRIIAMQYPMMIPPNQRTNIDYVFIFGQNCVRTRKRLYEQYGGMFPRFENFCQAMDQCATGGRFRCLVIDNTARSHRLEDYIFWYEASLADDSLIRPATPPRIERRQTSVFL